MIKHVTYYDHSKKEWTLTPKLTFKSRYRTYFMRGFNLSNYKFDYPAVEVVSPLLGPTCLTVWSK